MTLAGFSTNGAAAPSRIREARSILQAARKVIEDATKGG
jgi:hypothetical protein